MVVRARGIPKWARIIPYYHLHFYLGEHYMLFNPGDRVKVEFNGTVWQTIIESDGNGIIVVKDDVLKNYHQIAIENVKSAEPENWPPQVGDIWETEDGKEFAVYDVGKGKVIFAFNAPSLAYDDTEINEFKAKNPKLIRRRDGVK